MIYNKLKARYVAIQMEISPIKEDGSRETLQITELARTVTRTDAQIICDASKEAWDRLGDDSHTCGLRFMVMTVNEARKCSQNVQEKSMD